jgi:hypothetical protein
MSKARAFKLKAWAFKSKAWAFKSKAWAFKSKAWAFESKAWAFESKAWAFESKAWAFKSKAWAFGSKAWAFGSDYRGFSAFLVVCGPITAELATLFWIRSSRRTNGRFFERALVMTLADFAKTFVFARPAVSGATGAGERVAPSTTGEIRRVARDRRSDAPRGDRADEVDRGVRCCANG